MNKRMCLYRHIQCHSEPCPEKARCYNRGMKVSTKRLPDSQVLLEIEADEQQMERSLDKAFRRLSQRVEVPGFRKGKAPAGMLERQIGHARVVRADVRGVIDGKEVYKEDDAELRLREGAAILPPGIAEGIIGAEKGILKEIPVTVPEGERQLSGKSGAFALTVKEVKEEQLPALNDDFARDVGEGFASLDALRVRLRNDIRERMDAQAEEEYR